MMGFPLPHSLQQRLHHQQQSLLFFSIDILTNGAAASVVGIFLSVVRCGDPAAVAADLKDTGSGGGVESPQLLLRQRRCYLCVV